MEKRQKNTKFQNRLKSKKTFNRSFLKRSHKLSLKEKLSLLDIKALLNANDVILIHITIFQNNVFCILKNLKKILVRSTSESFKLKVTSKRLRKNLKLIIHNFLIKCLPFLSKRQVFLRIIAPTRFKKNIIQQFSENERLYSRIRFMEILSKKCYNGCRASKMRRKKRRGLLLLKH